MLKPLVIAALLVCAGCSRSKDEAKIIGAWQCNPRNGTVWRMTFSDNHRVTLATPRDSTVDATQRDAAFDATFTGTWRIDRDELVYTIEDSTHGIPKTTTRMKLVEFARARPFGTDPEAYLERLE